MHSLQGKICTDRHAGGRAFHERLRRQHRKHCAVRFNDALKAMPRAHRNTPQLQCWQHLQIQNHNRQISVPEQNVRRPDCQASRATYHPEYAAQMLIRPIRGLKGIRGVNQTNEKPVTRRRVRHGRQEQRPSRAGAANFRNRSPQKTSFLIKSLAACAQSAIAPAR